MKLDLFVFFSLIVIVYKKKDHSSFVDEVDFYALNAPIRGKTLV